ncbi:hypothetical protein K469DRAFT_723972 [Zopfia rhizophila CBS 207.26]|uniref:DUF8021 domain-containing protein n=1 Tax=Zopfia rhizophila CBS 207.26 TaxID=1314779 RepID=A0A6A6EBK8_9PEZI|nr:hypothetical protein K469DRAFT_723972 [Zopfia rhizophila CBS 207.26]
MLPLFLPTLALVASVTAHCTRPQLMEAVDHYIATQRNGSIDSFKTRFDNSTWQGYFENSKKVEIEAGILSHALNPALNKSLYDTTACATYTELIVNDTSKPYVRKVDTIVTTTKDWLFNITGNMYWIPRENWGPIPEAQRDTRETIKKAADAYADLFNNPNVTVPWGNPCTRLEGGLYTAPNDTCNSGVPSGVQLTNRRYVIDETIGAVDIFLDFGTSKWPDSHEFRVENGKIRYVHTMTVCGIPNCGVGNSTAAFWGRKRWLNG